MRVSWFPVAALLLALGVALPAWAQFGHPLKGTWTGEWGPGKTHVVIEMTWDGKAIGGTINPGPNHVALKKATLDPDTWAVHLEGEGKDASGKVVQYALDGKLENIGSSNRVITGTWMQGGAKGDVRLVRN